MTMDFMKTDGGPHPADLWAVKTSAQIVQLMPTAGSEARKLELQIIEALEECHAKVQNEERAKLEEFGEDRLTQPLDPTEHMLTAMRSIMKVANATSFKEHFVQQSIHEYLRNVLGQHFATSMQIERQWYVARQRQLGD